MGFCRSIAAFKAKHSLSMDQLRCGCGPTAVERRLFGLKVPPARGNATWSLSQADRAIGFTETVLCTFLCMRQPAKAIQRKQFVFIDGGTTNLAAARIIPERLSNTVATQYSAIAAALAPLRKLVSFWS